MARFAFKASDEYALKLSQLGAQGSEIAKEAIFEGANMLADKVRSNLEALPNDTFRRLKEGEVFVGVPETQKKDLLDSLGITSIGKDLNGIISAKVGFDGYGSHPTRKYKKGVPNNMLGRAIESGSSVRRKTPFVRPAVTELKERVIEKMDEVARMRIEKLNL